MMESLMACGRRLTTRQGKEHNAAWAAICADRDGAACPQKSGAKAARMASPMCRGCRWSVIIPREHSLPPPIAVRRSDVTENNQPTTASRRV